MSSVSESATRTASAAGFGRLAGAVNTPALVLGAAILLAWSVASATEWVNERVLPAPADVVSALAGAVTDASLWSAVWATLGSWLISLSIAVIAAAVLGVLIGSVPVLHLVFSTLIEFFRPIPSVAILPLALLLFGPESTTKILLTTYTAFWPMLVQTIYGVRSTDPVLKDVAASINLGPIAMRRRVVLPSALPSMAVGFRIGASVSLILCVTLEIIVGMNGLGREIFIAQNSGASDTMYAYIAVAGLLGWGLNVLVQRVEKAALHWHTANSAGSR
jgi:ABC-type nitrate/sulfonate/bicarbonate transport system permease component